MAKVESKIPKNPGGKSIVDPPQIHSLNVSKADIKLLEDKVVKLPENKVYNLYKNINCSDEERGWTETLSLNKSITLNRSFTLNNTINSTKNLTFGFQYGILSGSSNSTKTVTLTNSKTWSESEVLAENSSRSIELKVKTRKALYVKLQKTIYHLRIPFKGTVTVDGEIFVSYIDKRGGKPYSLKSFEKRYLKLSELLDNDGIDIEIEGFVENSSASELEILYFERNTEDEECELPELLPTEKKPEFRSSNIENYSGINNNELKAKNEFTKLRNLTDDKEVEVPKDDKFKTNANNEVIEEYFGSTTITTSDSAGSIWIRHQSYGPGLCNLDTRTNYGNVVTTNAPLASWSNWQMLASHFGSISYVINNSVNCDTGVRSQVKYFKK
ncbi:MAG: hypothetical protein ABJI22_11795 [Maribacter sp.]